MSTADVKSITKALGPARIQAALGVSHHSIRYARTSGKFPGRWYGPLSKLCLEQGIPCPLSAFSWAGPGEADADATSDGASGAVDKSSLSPSEAA